MGGAGRPYALAKYLPSHGYRVHVVTVKDIVYPGYDYSPLDNLNRERIYRTGSFDPARILYLLGMRVQKRSGYPGITGQLPLYLPDLKRGWNYFAYRKARELIERFKIPLVITTSPPPSSHLIGLKLKMRTRVKWIADFRDYWFPLPIEQIYKQGFARNYSIRLKDMIAAKADEIVSVNEDIREYFGRGRVIYNGADEAVAELWHDNRSGNENRFTVGLFGTFNELVPIEPLLAAIGKIIDSGDEGKRKIFIKHTGPSNSSTRELAAKYGLSDRVEFQGYLPKEKAIRSLSACDLFYIALKNMAPYHILPGRMFELFMSGKTIIGMVPRDSAVAKLINEYPGGKVIDNMSVEALADAIVSCLRDPEQLSFSPGSDSRYKYSARRTADHYAGLIKSLI